MIPVSSEGSVSVSGLVGVGLQARSNRARQTFIVNGRTIRSALLTQALEDACRERVTIGHYPICVLNIDMPNALVDVNVHPNKLEVRFSNENLIYQSVKGAVQDSFTVSPLASAPSLFPENKEDRQSAPAVRVIDTDTSEGLEQARRENAAPAEEKAPEKPPVHAHVVPVKLTGTEGAEKPVSRPTPIKQADFSSFVTNYFGGAALRESVIPARENAPQVIVAPVAVPEEEPHAKQAESEEKTPPVPPEEKAAQPEKVAEQQMLPVEDAVQKPNPLQGYKMIGVAFDTYIMLQNDMQMIFIDQHAAHERILYEKLMREIDSGAGSQVLMVAQVVHVTPQDRAKIEQYAQEIASAGFDIEPFGDDAYQIRAVPNVLGVPQSREAFLDMVDHLGELRVLSTQQKRRDAILQMACKKAVKGGDRLSMEEIEPLLADMLATGAPPTCPHGRPLVVTLTRSELEKRFRRINN